ncbi:hypothetical protein BJ912DRAFT_642776 [Pholiota molesta]|nr:hypothetical protein BJ912DRAFT_642776 [Pholiota molesta]
MSNFKARCSPIGLSTESTAVVMDSAFGLCAWTSRLCSFGCHIMSSSLPQSMAHATCTLVQACHCSLPIAQISIASFKLQVSFHPCAHSVRRAGIIPPSIGSYCLEYDSHCFLLFSSPIQGAKHSTFLQDLLNDEPHDTGGIEDESKGIRNETRWCPLGGPRYSLLFERMRLTLKRTMCHRPLFHSLPQS